MIVKAIPASMIVRTAARARGVRTLSGVTSVPSTSATTRRTPLGTSSLLAITSASHSRNLVAGTGPTLDSVVSPALQHLDTL